MNEVLILKNKFEQKNSSGRPGPSNIPKNATVTRQHLIDLKTDLERVQAFWQEQPLLINPLVSVYYNTVIAKSNRIKGILEPSSLKNNRTIVGAKFSQGVKKKHIITHCISKETIQTAIDNLNTVITIIKTFNVFSDSITHYTLDDINHNKFAYIFSNDSEFNIKKSLFVNIIVDAYYVEKFDVEMSTSDLENNAIITIYDTGVKTKDLMQQLGINFLDIKTIDETTILLNPNQYKLLKSKAPFLISMAVEDLSSFALEDISTYNSPIVTIPQPTNEPIIGVIDTMFDQRVYFSEWVEFKNCLDENLELTNEDYQHGTMVSSLIVDGPALNPHLDDGCGRFRVRHFGVATQRRFSSFAILRAIQEIITTNRDIKVWNLSLGSSLEINPNFISPEAYILDKIQYENDVIFVIAGTNKSPGSNINKIGAPADSINSLVVNSVGTDHQPTSYSREGLVLSFFNKPDVSYYGGDHRKKIITCSPLGECHVQGTSFAAPWIARKLAYLIDVLGLNRELAKALIIDATTGWENYPLDYQTNLIGYGVVPIHINEIISTPHDEIKILISDVSEKFDTYNYNLPIPIDKQKQPFIAKATLCYFPNCSRNQGVDYTNTEMDIHLGRLKQHQNGRIDIKCINDNKQSTEHECKVLLYEDDARKLYRKWDNVKHIRENLYTPTGLLKKPKQVTDSELWGISIQTNEEFNPTSAEKLKFGVVITLKELHGKNRIQEFIQQCLFHGWIINKINLDNLVKIYQLGEETLNFE